MAQLPDSLVHEAEFRGSDIVHKRATKRLFLCGIGALGSRLLDILIAQGYLSISILDKDRVEPSNCGVQNYGLSDVGRMKATQSQILTARKFGINIDAKAIELREGNVKILKDYDLVIDVFDNAASRKIIKDYCLKQKIQCVHCGMSSDGFTEIEWNENYIIREIPDADEQPPCDYPLATNLVVLSVGLLAEVVNRYIDCGVKQSLHFTLKDMHVHRF